MKTPVVSIEHFQTTSPTEEKELARELTKSIAAAHFNYPTFKPSTDDAGAPQPDNGLHWSIAHKQGWCASVIADKPIGIDIELYRERSPQLMAIFTALEWRAMGERTWLNFYRMWTAKEALIKRDQLTIDVMQTAKVVDWVEPIITLRHDNTYHEIQTFLEKDYIYALAT